MEVEQQWHRVHWILLRLRRAHLDGPPAQPAKALAASGKTLVYLFQQVTIEVICKILQGLTLIDLGTTVAEHEAGRCLNRNPAPLLLQSVSAGVMRCLEIHAEFEDLGL
jgi:hypothetical protein